MLKCWHDGLPNGDGWRRATRLAGQAARVRILKRGNLDHRDEDLGTTLEIVEDGSLQQMAPGLFVVFG